MHCFRFIKGICDAGDSCRWAHLTAEEVKAKGAQPKAKAVSPAVAETPPEVALPCVILEQEQDQDTCYHLAGVCAEVCAVLMDDEDNKIFIGRKHQKNRISAPRNLLMPDEFTDTKTKDQLSEQRRAEKGENHVPVKIPIGYFQSKSFHIKSELDRKVALRKAELLGENLVVEKYEDEYIVEDYKGQVFQILVNYEEGIDFLSSTDLPPCVYQDYSDSIDETPKSVETKVEPTKTKDRLSSDYWILKEDGLLIRKHVVPRTNLYDPDFDHEPLKNLKIKETRITHVQFVTGRSDVVIDQWSQPGNNQVMKRWWDKLFSSWTSPFRRSRTMSACALKMFHQCPKANGFSTLDAVMTSSHRKWSGAGQYVGLTTTRSLHLPRPTEESRRRLWPQCFAKSSRIWWSHSCCRTRQLCCLLEGAACKWAMASTGIQGKIPFS
jgi:hypothetical protein